MGVGVGQRGGLGAVHDAEMAQLAFKRGQSAADLAQALGIGELAEHHGNELLPAGETAGVALGVVFAGEGLELEAREELQKLAENAGYSIHGGDSFSGRSQFLAET